MKLLRRFTGARVVLRGPGGTVVPGSDDPARVRGPRVVRYRVRGFPAMRVAVALLVRPPRPA
jgi:hypothetical protein